MGPGNSTSTGIAVDKDGLVYVIIDQLIVLLLICYCFYNHCSCTTKPAKVVI